MDSLFTSERILISNESCKKLIAGGVLVDQEGRIKRIFTSQEEINSWLFIEHGGEVIFRESFCFIFRESDIFRERIFNFRESEILFIIFRFLISATKLLCRV